MKRYIIAFFLGVSASILIIIAEHIMGNKPSQTELSIGFLLAYLTYLIELKKDK